MAKKNKKNNGNVHTDSSVIFTNPVVVSIDVLAGASDSELRARNNDLENEKDAVMKEGYDPRLWEVELAYVQREMDIRKTRMHAHEKYLRNNPDEVDFYAINSNPMATTNAVN